MVITITTEQCPTILEISKYLDSQTDLDKSVLLNVGYAGNPYLYKYCKSHPQGSGWVLIGKYALEDDQADDLVLEHGDIVKPKNRTNTLIRIGISAVTLQASYWFCQYPKYWLWAGVVTGIIGVVNTMITIREGWGWLNK